jgi:ribosomal protein L17
VVSLATEEEVEAIIRAFLAGVARGATEQFPTAEQAGKSIGRRVTRGRSRKADPVTKKVRKISAYQKAYGKNFKKVAPKYKKKDGGWKKDGFKRAQAEAHKLTKAEMKK